MGGVALIGVRLIYPTKVVHHQQRTSTTNRGGLLNEKSFIKRLELLFDPTSGFVKYLGLKIIYDFN